MEHCELIPGRGIRRGDTDIFFGMTRKKLRDALGWKSGGDNIWDDEDEYSDAEGNDWVRLRFLDDKLCDIEVMGGQLTHEGIDLLPTSMPALRAALKKGGMALEKTEWLSEGHDCVDLQIVVASRDDIGDAGDEIEWVITSSDFRVE
ncbi:MAG: hypothetical protein AAGC76_11910 [Luteibacter sp.]|jgi:hypothetical protein|uniref:hypothetical protein n=1 Tax=Rhodanobacteraceae TaxID=1775411 RepID=UPI0005BA02CB|nr:MULTISPECIES: hypothetical protein [Rhodanobacteraceae]MDQ7996545.1 hypothetical protein [Luteibacter sp.]MDQ8048476.1 hypothetical protein [Luteibacter sp.]SDG68027.1 hypothetical protein SAMN04515659_3324 [Dyella sp. 333MFSha]SKB39159.1 hypothetical protein SAMN05660880_00876 [Luteibacter sp. 22Crub2.1]